MPGRKRLLRIRKPLRKATESYRPQYLEEKRKVSYYLCIVLVCLGIAMLHNIMTYTSKFQPKNADTEYQ